MKRQSSEVDSPRSKRSRWQRLALAGGTLVAVAATVAVASSSAAADGVQPNVIGGNPPTLNYPGGALVSLKYDAPSHDRKAWHTCGAALMDGVHLRTAAHCVTDLPPGLSAAQRSKLAQYFNLDAVTLAIPSKDKSFWVRVGSANKDEGGIVARVTVKWVHQNWKWATEPGAEVFIR